MKTVYLDNAATTTVSASVLTAMLPFLKNNFGNPSEPHYLGIKARQAVENCRRTVQSFFNLKDGQVVFTSGATESINLALKGSIEASLSKFSNSNFQFSNKKPHLITTAIEHKATLETAKHLETLGFAKVTYLPVDDEGLISFDDLEKKITKDTVLVSLIYVNNETGTVQPVEKLGQLLEKINKTRKMPIALHLDATQAVAYLNTDMQKLKVDLLSMSAHKINGPKGTGVLVYRKNVSLVRQMDGGSQEDNLRSGTENVAGIVGLARALTDLNNKKQIAQKVSVLRDKLIKGVLAIDGVRLTGSPKQRAPHIASFVFDGLEGESLVLMLSDKGVAAASGSACTAGNLNPSHVLTAMGVKKENCHGSLRLSLSSQTTEAEIDRVLKVLPLLVKKLRLMAPQL